MGFDIGTNWIVATWDITIVENKVIRLERSIY